MVFLKANKAEGSFLGRGTHVWLEILGGDKKTTFSGSKCGKMLHVLRDYKRDYGRDHARGIIEIPAPSGSSDAEWREAVEAAALEVQNEMHDHYAFNGFWPWGKNGDGIPRSNCCCVAQKIIERAGGEIPKERLRGVLPGLGRGWVDYL